MQKFKLRAHFCILTFDFCISFILSLACLP
jgi:hypothetical protein